MSAPENERDNERGKELRAFFRPRRTWRWNRGQVDGYDAVEATMESLVWYRWSHAANGGRSDVARQTISEFREKGPPPQMGTPKGVVAELSEWLSATPASP